MGYLIGGIVCIILGICGIVFVIVTLRDNDTDKFLVFTFKDSPSTGIISGIIAVLLLFGGIYLCWAQYNTASGERSLKNYKSEHSGGLVRKVDVYDNYGHLLQHYEGKLDVETNDAGTKVLFDLNGKRTIIYGAIVIVQEK